VSDTQNSIESLDKKLLEQDLITALLCCEIGYVCHEKGQSLDDARERIRNLFHPKDANA